MAQIDDQKTKITLWGYQFERWSFYTYILLSVHGFIVLATFLDYGLTTDEPPLLNYGLDILRWYKSGFTYQPIFETTNTWLYGGLVHVLGYVLSEILPFSPFDSYHLCCAIIGFLGVVAAYRIGYLLGGGPAGFLAALFLILTPRYYGHIFNNPKDIPFAVFYLWSIFWIIRGLGSLPNLPRDWIWKTGLVIGLTLGCRVAGLVLFFYLGLFWGLRYVVLIWDGLSVGVAVRKFVLQMLGVVAVAYVVMLPLWPWAMLHPITGPFEAMGYFSKFLEPHFSYFDGKYVLNHDVPWFYVSKWLLLTLPELVMAGLVCGLVHLGFCKWSGRRIASVHIQHVALIWAWVFPTVYAAVTHTPFYDGYRHMFFVVPPLVICSALGVAGLLKSVQSVVWHRVMLMSTMALVMWTLVYIVRIHPNQAMYFNHAIAGGIQKASVNFETDYWGNSFKQGLDWIAAHYPWDYSKRKLQVASRFGQLHNVMDTTRFERVEVYEEADLYLGTTRFDYHRVVAGEVVHTVDVDDVPVLYVIRPDETYHNDPLFTGSAFRRMALRLQFEGPLADEERATFLQQVEDQNLHYFVAGTYNNMAKEAHEKGNYDAAVSLYQEGLRFYPGHLMALYNYGLALYQRGEYEAVVQQYDIAFAHKAKRILDKETLANMDYTLGLCYLALEDFASAEQLFRPLVAQHPQNTIYRMHFANALIKGDHVEAALKQCQEVVKLSPDKIDAHVLMGQIYQAIGETELARGAYDAAQKIEPDNEMLQELIQSIEE